MTSRSAAIYVRKTDFVIQPKSRTTSGLWIGWEPVQVLGREVDMTSVGQAVQISLDASRHGVAHPTDWKALLQPLFQAAKIKSWNAIQKSAKLVQIRLTDSELRIVPTRNGGTAGDDKGYHSLEERAIVLPADCSAEQLGSALSEGLELCC